MKDASKEERNLEAVISQHIFTASSAMIGVCLTVIGLFKINDRLRMVNTWGDEFMAIDALVFLAACLCSYISLRSKNAAKKKQLEKTADFLFLLGLCLMALVCSEIAFALF